MFLSKGKTAYLFLLILPALLATTLIFAGDKKDQSNPEESVMSLPASISPIQERESTYNKLPTWGTDVLIVSGSAGGGISATYDSDGNMYAARCSTTIGITRKGIQIYKSTDKGETWAHVNSISNASGYQYSYPQLLVCESGVNEYLCVFYLRSDGNGHVRVTKYTTDGELIGDYELSRPVTNVGIDYFSACSDPDGGTLIVVYQYWALNDETQNVRCTRSTDCGATWNSGVDVASDGVHPDVTCGVDGYVDVVYQTTLGDDEIRFRRSTDYGDSWESSQALTADSYDDGYPKVAASHTSPADAACVWVTYSKYMSSWDLRYAYSTDAGASWTKEQILSSGAGSDGGANLGIHSFYGGQVCVCYHQYEFVLPGFSRLYYASATTSDPGNWQGSTQINDYFAAPSLDGRETCALTFYKVVVEPFVWHKVGIVYAGAQGVFPQPTDILNLYFDGQSYTDVEETEEEEIAPSEFSLSVNYPNPFNPVTRIQYSVGSKETQPIHTTLRIYNVLGQLVKTLVNEPKEPGTYEVVWDGRDENGNEVASGIYFYRLQAEDFTEAKKMLLLR